MQESDTKNQAGVASAKAEGSAPNRRGPLKKKDQAPAKKGKQDSGLVKIYSTRADLFNPFTKQWITGEPVSVLEDSWVVSQIEVGLLAIAE